MTNNSLSPIVLFVYNRPQHTQRTLEALSENDLAQESVLYIYADGAKEDASYETLQSIKDTREIIKSKQWCKEVHIIESKTNKGLADSIVSGVTEIINQHEKVIVLEDDIVTASGFLHYMNDALSLYEKEESVMHVSGFVPQTTGADKLPETYFLRFMSCWGWATWKRAWDKIILDTDYIYATIPALKDSDSFNLEGAIDIFAQVRENYLGVRKTWAFKWYSTIFIEKGLCLYPFQTLVLNIGHDGSGTNCSSEYDRYNVTLTNKVNVRKTKIQENQKGKDYLKRFYFFGNNPTTKQKILYTAKESFMIKFLRRIKNGKN